MKWLYAVLYFLAFFYLTPNVSAQESPLERLSGDMRAAWDAQVESCVEKYRGDDTGVLELRDVCEVRAWALVGRQYPEQARAALEAEQQAQRFAGRVNELREQFRLEQEQTDRMAERIGQLKGRPTRRQAALWGVGAGTVGFAVGAILTAVLTGLAK